jgi:hypothetical protein
MSSRLLALIAFLSTPLAACAASPDSVFDAYVHAVLAEDWPSAEACWLANEVTLSKRLNVEFTGYPLKVDCTSPLLEHRAALRMGTLTYAVSDSSINDTLTARVLEIRSGQSTVRHTYLLAATADGWRLTSPIYQATRAWPALETRFARIRCPDESLLNTYAIDALDAFIDSLGTLFYFEPRHWVLLGRERIEYYLADAEQIRALSGYDAHGMTFLPLDAILTSHLPHEHELTHALFNFRLRELAMYTLPALQEGVAVAYGGRWGKTPGVIMHLGAFVLKSELMTVDDILTYQGFNSDASDLSYALGGLFTRCLIESIGFPKFTVLYRRLSGPQSYIRNMTAYDVRKAVEETTNQPWELLIPSCVEREAAIFSRRGIDPSLSIPESELVWETPVPLTGKSFRITVDSSFYYFEVKGERAGSRVGFFVLDSAQFLEGVYRSRLFSDQFPEEAYDGQIMGVVFDSLEAGVYDYRTDMLLAKFASGFSQGESMWDSKGRVIRFRVAKSILPLELNHGNKLMIW